VSRVCFALLCVQIAACVRCSAVCVNYTLLDEFNSRNSLTHCAGARCASELSSTLGVARCGLSAGCVLCALWAVSAAVLGVPCGGKHTILLMSVERPRVCSALLCVCVCIILSSINSTPKTARRAARARGAPLSVERPRVCSALLCVEGYVVGYPTPFF